MVSGSLQSRAVEEEDQDNHGTCGREGVEEESEALLLAPSSLLPPRNFPLLCEGSSIGKDTTSIKETTTSIKETYYSTKRDLPMGAASGSVVLLAEEAGVREGEDTEEEAEEAEEEEEEEEEVVVGAGRGWGSFWWHFKEGVGGWGPACLIIGLMLTEMAMVELGVYSLTRWADFDTRSKGEAAAQQSYYLTVYAVVVVAEVLVCALRNGAYVVTLRHKVQLLHQELTNALLYAPLSLFEAARTGTLVNLFSQRLPQMDEPVLMASDFYLYGCGFGLFVGVMCCFYIYWLVFVGALVCMVLGHLASIFDSARSLRTVQLWLRAPIMDHLSETVEGLLSVRAYGYETAAVAKLAQRMDAHSRAALACLQAESWLMVRTMLLSTLFYASTALGLVLHARDHGIARGLFQVAAADGAFILLNLCFGSFCVHSYIVRSLELQGLARVRASLTNFIHAHPPEQGLHEPCVPPPVGGGEYVCVGEDGVMKGWPGSGRLDLKEVVLRYPSQAPGSAPALRGLTISLASGDRLGVVGRTGAGKSTILSALLRLVVPESGCVLYDGVDTARLSLQQLRGNISVVSQDPVLFAGTLRSNLDPFHEIADDAPLWHILQITQLASHVESHGGLDMEMAEQGDNLSHGQRQLVSIGRALLRRRKVMLLDEATSSLDLHSEALVLNAVSEHAGGATVIQVAHRLEALQGCTRILVLESGLPKECAPPSVLLDDPGSLLSRMVASAGGNAEALRHKLTAEALRTNSPLRHKLTQAER
jgi:ABC-type multidrug transport system fused ATPase/permease subunit